MHSTEKVNIIIELTSVVYFKYVVLCVGMLFISLCTGKLRFSLLGTETLADSGVCYSWTALFEGKFWCR
jgi:hypothetical protein